MNAHDDGWSHTGETWPAPLVVGVVSDTHFHAEPAGQQLPRLLLDELAKAQVGLILHAGDILAAWVLDQLSTIAPVLAVIGNGDPADLRQALPRQRVVTVGAHLIGLVHGHEGRGRSTPERARNAFADPTVGCIVFGHTHQPLSQLHDGVILFNPGSPTDRRRQRYFSFGLLRIGETIEPELVYFLP
ncbi:MAG TPA: metallophosphoesterase family protein [Thermomicrobiales bacterium]|jgi:putative phosphoesterase|nr:metallophosphoesterase family protein [Thermomicrobiales bacterium]